MVEEIKNIIQQALPDAKVYVSDPYNDGQHFQALVISAQFDGLPLVRQHQLVMNAVGDAFEQSVHALSLKTFTPAKWESKKALYGKE